MATRSPPASRTLRMAACWPIRFGGPDSLLFRSGQRGTTAMRRSVGDRSRAAAFTYARATLRSPRSEGEGRPLGRVGSKHLHGVGSGRRRVVRLPRQRVGTAGLVGQPGQPGSPRVAMVERGGILPLLPEASAEVAHHRAPDLELHVMPGRSRPELGVDPDGLGAAQVAGIVPPAVAQVDPTVEVKLLILPARMS